MDSLKQVIQKAIEDRVLVVKSDGLYIKNPSLGEVRQLLNKHYALTFRRIIGPDKLDRKHKYMQEAHVRGNSVHVDMRWTLGEQKVSGITIAVPFAVPNAKAWAEAIDKATQKVLDHKIEKKEDWAAVKPKQRLAIKALIEEDLPEDFFNEPFLAKYRPEFLDWDRKHVFIPKAIQDTSWFEQPFTIIPPNFVGAGKYVWAALSPFDHGEIEFGAVKPDYVEVFLYSDFYNGKLSMIFLPREQVATLPDDSDERIGREMWVGLVFTTKSQLPYCLSDRAIEEDYLPEKGVSALPAVIRRRLPEECQYWKDGDKEKRDAAVSWAKKNLESYTRKSPNDVPKAEELWRF